VQITKIRARSRATESEFYEVKSDVLALLEVSPFFPLCQQFLELLHVSLEAPGIFRVRSRHQNQLQRNEENGRFEKQVVRETMGEQREAEQSEGEQDDDARPRIGGIEHLHSKFTPVPRSPALLARQSPQCSTSHVDEAADLPRLFCQDVAEHRN
jgi:hypothetical protein